MAKALPPLPLATLLALATLLSTVTPVTASPPVEALPLVPPPPPEVTTEEDPPVNDTYVFVGYAGMPRAVEGADRICVLVGTEGGVDPASDVCWQENETQGDASSSTVSQATEAVGVIVNGEIVLGAVIFGQPYCFVKVDQGGPSACCTLMREAVLFCTVGREREPVLP